MCAGQIAYEELRQNRGSQSQTAPSAAPVKNTAPVKKVQERVEQIPPEDRSNNQLTGLAPPALIEYATKKIKQEELLDEKFGKLSQSKKLTDLEKGRMIVQFLNKKQNPLKNRHFFKHFFNQQTKAEKIEAFENIENKIQQVIQAAPDE